jgi:hypothetical protein
VASKNATNETASEERGLTAAECGARVGISKGAWMQLVRAGRAPAPALEFNNGAGLRVSRRWLPRQLDEWLDEQVARARRSAP